MVCSVVAEPQLISPRAAAGTSAALALGAGVTKMPVGRGLGTPRLNIHLLLLLGSCKHCLLVETGQDMISKS